MEYRRSMTIMASMKITGCIPSTEYYDGYGHLAGVRAAADKGRSTELSPVQAQQR